MTIDNISLIVNLLILIAVVVFYMGFYVWFNFRRKDLDRAVTGLREGALLLIVLGSITGIIALWGELTFPLPGSYNVFFFDPLALLALLIGTFGLTVWFRLPTHFVGVLGVVVGSGIIFYGARAFQLGLTTDPLETFLLYLAFGCLAIGSIIPTLFMDWFVLGPKSPNVQPIGSSGTPEFPRLWTALLAIFLAVAFLAGLAALLYAFGIVWGHLV
ncbi:MAG: DUF981 family protein [Thermoplasmata archaeon]